jgi:hypothetical protein
MVNDMLKFIKEIICLLGCEHIRQHDDMLHGKSFLWGIYDLMSTDVMS